MKKKLLLTLSMAAVMMANPLTIYCADGSKPENHQQKLHREVELALTELRDIKASEPVIGCVAEGDRLTVVVRRHTVVTGVPVNVPGLVSCRVENNRVFYVADAVDIGWTEKAKYIGLGFGVGSLAIGIMILAL
jgi:hypothetical protein